MDNIRFFIKEFRCEKTGKLLFYETIKVGEDGKHQCIGVGFPAQQVTLQSLEEDLKKLEAKCLSDDI